jgi:hypothetical protein
VIEQYLSQYAEVEARTLFDHQTLHANLQAPHLSTATGPGTSKPEHPPYQGCLVIPAFDEDPNVLIPQVAGLANHRLLVVLVINAPTNAETGKIRRTQALLEELTGSDFEHVWLVDRVAAESRLNPKHGVGLARKIGCDLALALWHNGWIESPWLLQSDADVTFPQDYAAILHSGALTSADPAPGALIYPHAHISDDPALRRAAGLYDQHMNYYVAGLAVAGSRYAHHSLGSTIAVHARAYAAVRGYPKRSAGEDFYLLNKIRKIADIQRLPGPVLQIQARLSTRVPFGTGPALASIQQSLIEDPSGFGYLSYHPECFALLTTALEALNRWAEQPERPLPEDIGTRLNAQGFEDFAANQAKQNTQPQQRHQWVHDWFDGLKTLQFVRGCGEAYPDQPLLQTLAHLEPNFRTKVIEFQTNNSQELLTPRP